MTRVYEVTADDGTYTVFESRHTTTGSERSAVAVFKSVSSDVADSYMGPVPDVDGEPVVYAGQPGESEEAVDDVSDVHIGVLSVLESYDVTVIDVPVHEVEMSTGDTHRFMDFSDYSPVSVDEPSEIPA